MLLGVGISFAFVFIRSPWDAAMWQVACCMQYPGGWQVALWRLASVVRCLTFLVRPSCMPIVLSLYGEIRRDTARYGEIWRDMAIFFHIWPPRVQSSTPPHRRCSCRHVWLAYWPIPCTCARHRPPTLNITHPTASLPPSMGRRHTAARQALGGAVALFRAWYVCRFTTCGECSRGVW